MLKRTSDLGPGDWSWAVGFNLSLLGIATCLRAFDVSWILVLGWALLSEAIFVVLEPELIAFLFEPPYEKHRAISKQVPTTAGTPSSPPGGSIPEGSQPESNTQKDSPVRDERSEAVGTTRTSWLLRRRWRRLVEVYVVLGLAVLVGIVSRTILRPPNPPATVNAQAIIDQLESALKQCLDHTCNAGNSGGGNGNFGGGTLRLDPALQQAIIDSLKQAASANASSNSWCWWGGGLVLVLIAAAVAIALTVRKRPATAAPLGAVGLAVAIIKSENHFSRLDPAMWWYVFWLLTATLVALAVFAVLQFNTPPADTDDDTAGEKKEVRKVESPLNTFFSIAVLLWAILLVCYRPESKSGSELLEPKPQSVSYKMLKSIPGFVKGSTAIPGRDSSADPVIALIESLGKEPTTGDMLLLLGSADCTKISEGSRQSVVDNKTLAEGRANAVMKALPKEFSQSVNVQVAVLHQYDGCRESKDLRAVFPILIQHQGGWPAP